MRIPAAASAIPAMPPNAHPAESVAAPRIQSRLWPIQPLTVPPVAPKRPNPMTARHTHWSLGRWRTVAAANGPLSVHGCQSPWTRNSARAMMRTAALMCPVTKLMASMDGSLLPVGDDGVDGEEHEDEDDEDDGKNVHGRLLFLGDDDGDDERGHGPVAEDDPCPRRGGVRGCGVDGGDPEDTDRGRPQSAPEPLVGGGGGVEEEGHGDRDGPVPSDFEGPDGAVGRVGGVVGVGDDLREAGLGPEQDPARVEGGRECVPSGCGVWGFGRLSARVSSVFAL